MRVEVFTSSYAPGMAQLRPVSDRQLKKVLATVAAGGGPVDEPTALVPLEEVADLLGDRAARELDEWGSVRVNLDEWTVRQLYGYQAD